MNGSGGSIMDFLGNFLRVAKLLVKVDNLMRLVGEGWRGGRDSMVYG